MVGRFSNTTKEDLNKLWIEKSEKLFFQLQDWYGFYLLQKQCRKNCAIVDKPLIQYSTEEAIAAGIDTLIFVTGRNKRAIEDHFDANNEPLMLRLKGKAAQADMVRNIIPEELLECIFVRQAEPIGLGHAVPLCGTYFIGGEPFAVLLADDFLTDYDPGVTSDLVCIC